MKTSLKILVAALCLLAAWRIFCADGTRELEWKRGIFRVNSSVSSGNESIPQIATEAEEAGLDFVVFSDQFLVIAEYGLPPFRKIFHKVVERPSIVNFGIDNYLNLIAETARLHPKMAIIAGADIAPHYYWTGNPFKKNLAVNQYSEQLTVFGPNDPGFYRGLPVIHNNIPFKSWAGVLLRLSPLLLCVLALLLFRAARQPYYSDAQGHQYHPPAKIKLAFSAFLFLAGLLWCLNNRPFSAALGYDQYAKKGIMPYQKAIDYVRNQAGTKGGIVWSAPEAVMKDKIAGVFLFTIPYLQDIEETKGHNGLAGIYGDVSHAHEPGKSWDKMLREYCEGTRKELPAILGERDYHGRGGNIGLVQTVVHSRENTPEAIVKAIIEGRSYAVAKGGGILQLREACLREPIGGTAGLGETLTINDSVESCTLRISGSLAGASETTGRLVIVLNGEQYSTEILELKDFAFSKEIRLRKGEKMQYVRFYITTSGAGWLLSNPVFIVKTKG